MKGTIMGGIMQGARLDKKRFAELLDALANEIEACRHSILMPAFYVTYTIPLRDIFSIDGEKLRLIMSSYTSQCVKRIEDELEEHGGLHTLRIQLNETKHCIDFTGYSKGSKPNGKLGSE